MSEKVQSENQVLHDLMKKNQIFLVTAKMNLFAEIQCGTIIEQNASDRTDEYVNTTEQGTPQNRKIPRKRKTVVRNQRNQERPFYRFDQQGEKRVLKNFGGFYGVMDRGMRKVASLVKGRYFKPDSMLMSYCLEDGSVDLPIPKANIKNVKLLQKYNSRGGETRSPVFREFASDVPAKIRVTIPAGAPITRDEFIEYVHLLQYHGFGPTQKGNFQVVDVATIQ